MAVEKINITLPAETVEKLHRLVPAGRRSQVIAKATEQYLEQLTQKTVLHDIAGLWKDRTTLRTQADVSQLLKRLRGSTRARFTRLARRG